MNKTENFEILKGTRDFEPEEQIKINSILDIIRENFEKYGFRPFDTPIIELMNTLTYKYDEDAEIVGEIFKLIDRGNRNLGLRYDLTTPLARYVASKKQLKLPFKRYQIGKVFRDGPIKKGRLREFTQCDGDIVGIEGVEVEAEILTLFSLTYKQLEIDSIIELNNNKILRGVLLQVGFKEEDLSNLILSIDKLKKIGIDGVLKEIKGKGLNELRAKDAIKILESKNFIEIKKLAINPLLIGGIEELEMLSNLIKKSKVNFRINFSMSRGLDIYTGNIWEVYDKNKSISSSIGSGGRYDKVLAEYSNSEKEIPALGISFGLIPIIEVLNNKKEQINKKTNTDILIVPLEKELFNDTLNLANKLRYDKKHPKNVEIDYKYKLKKAFDYTDYLEIENIIILGKKDIEKKEYTLKNLKTKEEQIFKL